MTTAQKSGDPIKRKDAGTNRFRYPIVVTLGLWIAFAPAGADAQEIVGRVHDSSGAARPFLLTLPQVPYASQQRPAWVTSARFAADRELVGIAGVLGAQNTRNKRSERGLARKVFGALVGAAGGFFAGGYLGAKIEGDGCHCDDPGLKGFLIGAPIGAVAGGTLGSRYLF
jgi:hypothetical protein